MNDIETLPIYSGTKERLSFEELPETKVEVIRNHLKTYDLKIK